jgi:hypothetical protein
MSPVHSLAEDVGLLEIAKAEISAYTLASLRKI